MRTEYKILTVLLIILTIVSVTSVESNRPSLSIVGSSSVQPVCEQLTEEYRKTRNDIDINIQGGGSSLGIKCANSSVADIGMSSKKITCENLTEYEIGQEAIVIIVNENNPITDLSAEELQMIFSGEITNWEEISNMSGNIHTIMREEGSGTLDSFKNIIMKNKSIKKDATVQNSAGSIKHTVIQDKYAIGFVSLTHLDENLKEISIDGVYASKKSILDGSYKLQRPFILLTNETPGAQTDEFIKWVMSEESKSILEGEKSFGVDKND